MYFLSTLCGAIPRHTSISKLMLFTTKSHVFITIMLRRRFRWHIKRSLHITWLYHCNYSKLKMYGLKAFGLLIALAFIQVSYRRHYGLWGMSRYYILVSIFSKERFNPRASHIMDRSEYLDGIVLSIAGIPLKSANQNDSVLGSIHTTNKKSVWNIWHWALSTKTALIKLWLKFWNIFIYFHE